MLFVLFDNLRDWLMDAGVFRLFAILDQLTFRALAAAATAFFLVLLLGRPVIDWLRRKKIGDTGLTDAAALQRHTASKANTPTMGGILVAGSILAATALLADVRNFYIIVGLIVILWLAALGAVDDWLKLTSASRRASGGAGAASGGGRQGLYAWEKFVFQLGIGLIVGYFVYGKGDNPEVAHDMAHSLSLPVQGAYARTAEGVLEVNPSLVYLSRAAFIVIATLVIAGMSNAVNITDGMDGLAAGVTTAVSLGLVVLTYVAGWQAAAQYLKMPYIAQSDELLILGAATAGACLGFLWWNCSPAQVFMGDTGSLALGGVLAYLAIVIRQEILLLVMSGVFLIEIASVMLQVGWFKWTRIRTGAGRRIFKTAPLHHHLHLSGWPEQQVVARFWILSCLLVVLALALVKVR
jgi:phospho-N-acetylmuramoyl-pentapeptide-transferase